MAGKQDQIDECNRQLRQKKRELGQLQDERSSYMAEARKIGEIYDRLAENKRVVREKRDALNHFKRDEYTWFTGKLYQNSYQPSVAAVVQSYDGLIRRIDQNLDMLNDERRRYENKAYECDGMIGVLERGINYLGRSLQNLVN